MDADLGNLLFAYGARPNVRLTLLGLITSIPASASDQFDPLQEFAEAEGMAEVTGSAEAAEQDDPVAVERGFRAMFEAMEGLEAFTRFSRYPNVTVYPIAVYRRVPIALNEAD